MAELGNQRSKRVITGVSLLGIEKRYVPNKHYLYILSVKWSEGSEFIIYRRYSAFFQLHQKLSELFPIETGAVSKKDQTIPPLPKQRWFGNEKFKVADERMLTIDEYCRKVAIAEPKISEHEEVLSFFETLPEDLTPPPPDPKKPNKTYLTFESKGGDNKGKDKSAEKSGDELEISAPILLETYRAIATFTPGGKTEVRLEEGAHVDVVEKNMSGWWLVQVDEKQGWCPASYLEPLDQPEERDEERPNWQGEEFLTTEQYEAQIDDEISFDKGVIVHVIHKLLDGWWIVRYNDKVGYAPCAYLQKYSNPHLPLHKARVRTDSDRSTGSFIKKLPPRRSTIQKKSSAHEKEPKRRDLQIYRRKTQEASKRSNLAAKAREAYRRVSAVTEEPEGAYMDMEGDTSAATDGYISPDNVAKKLDHPYVNESVVEEIAGRKAKSSGPRPTEDLVTESCHVYINGDVVSQRNASSGNVYVNEESLTQVRVGGKNNRPADDVWIPAFVSPKSKAAGTRNSNSSNVNSAVWAPAFVDEEKSKKDFPKNPGYIDSNTVASMTGKKTHKKTQFLNPGYMPDAAPVSPDAWNQKGTIPDSSASTDYENIDVQQNIVAKGTTTRLESSPRTPRTPVPAPRNAAPNLLSPVTGVDKSPSGRSTPKSGRSAPKSGRSSPKSGRLSPSVPARPTAAEIAAKCSPQTKFKFLQAKQDPEDFVPSNGRLTPRGGNRTPKSGLSSPKSGRSSPGVHSKGTVEELAAKFGNLSKVLQRK
ncbi:uncharacterized protein LOC144875075 isoform X8 [Branchiostoma floridae x Branchiostoma japonicum]